MRSERGKEDSSIVFVLLMAFPFCPKSLVLVLNVAAVKRGNPNRVTAGNNVEQGVFPLSEIVAIEELSGNLQQAFEVFAGLAKD
jgi:hypothetical protein